MSKVSIKIVFFSHYLNLHGANRSLLHLIHGLKNYPVEPLIIIPEGEGELADTLKKHKINFKQIKFRYSYGKSKSGRISRLIKNSIATAKIVLFLRKQKVSLIYSNSSVINVGYWVARILGMPHIWHVREFGQEDYSLRPDWGMDYQNHLFNQSAAVISVSSALRNTTLRDVSNVTVIYNGVANEKDLRERDFSWPESDTPFCFLLLGQISSSKMQGTAIEAFAVVKKYLVGLGRSGKLILQGRGSSTQKEELKKLILNLELTGWVEIRDYTPEPLQAFKACHVALVCSKMEAMGRVTAEAMIAGRPVIGNATGGTVELIQDGVTGLLYSHSAKDLAEKMRYCIDHPSWVLDAGQKARQFAVTQFTEEQYTENVWKVIQKARSDFQVRPWFDAKLTKRPSLIIVLILAAFGIFGTFPTYSALALTFAMSALAELRLRSKEVTRLNLQQIERRIFGQITALESRIHTASLERHVAILNKINAVDQSLTVTLQKQYSEVNHLNLSHFSNIAETLAKIQNSLEIHEGQFFDLKHRLDTDFQKLNTETLLPLTQATLNTREELLATLQSSKQEQTIQFHDLKKSLDLEKQTNEISKKFDQLRSHQGDIYTHTKGQSEKIERRLKSIQEEVNVGFLGVQDLFSIYSILEFSSPLGHFGKSAICPDFAALLLNVIQEIKPNVVLELGSGLSTIIAGAILKKIGKGKLISIDQDLKYVGQTRTKINEHHLDEWVTLHHSPLKEYTIDKVLTEWYSPLQLQPESIDLVIIDGPAQLPTSPRATRSAALPLLFPYLAPQATLLLDDAKRDHEQETLQSWKHKFPEIQIEMLDHQKGAAIIKIGVSKLTHFESHL